MMVNRILRIKLLSDFCPASGDGFAGKVNNDICFDEENGLPYIPGKRLKGCLRECGLDILSVTPNRADEFNGLFGEKGRLIAGKMIIGNGLLENYDTIINSITSDIYRSEIAEVYTSMRTRTKMEAGKAAKGSLRTARVLNKAEVFEFPIAIEENLLDFFEDCVKSLRSMGLNRSRGMGEIKCQIIEKANMNGTDFKLVKCEDKKSLSYMLRLTDPVIAAERSGKPYGCESYIFGIAVLGAVAMRYIKKYCLDQESAYEDQIFRRLFLDGAVNFVAAMPFDGNWMYYPAPLTLKTNKIKTRFIDVSGGEETGEKDNKDEKNPICKSLGGFIATDENGYINPLNPNKTVFLHHARPKNKAIGHAILPDTNNPDDDSGQFFSYEALSAGQLFVGSIIGQEADLKLLAGLFAEDDTLRVGRSRTAQYGNVKISPFNQPVVKNNLELNTGDEFRVVAVTPLILENSNGINTTDLSLIADHFGSGKIIRKDEEGIEKEVPEFEIVRYFCTETNIAGYYGKWLLPRVQRRALAEGSVIVIKYNGAGTEISDRFIGQSNCDGFGQIRIELVPKAEDLHRMPQNANMRDNIGGKSPLTEKIYRLREDKKAVSEGVKYGDRLGEKAPLNTGLQRILSALRTSDDFMDFTRKILMINQPVQKVAALAFVCNMNGIHFKTDKERLAEKYITSLLKEQTFRVFPEVADKDYYQVYKKFLTVAATRVMQIRRDKAAKGGGNK